MIQLNELCLGSHVIYGGHRRIVQPYILCSEFSNLDKVRPILITPDILKEAGFLSSPFASYDDDYTDCPSEEWIKEINGCQVSVIKGIANMPNRAWAVHIDNADCDTIGSLDVSYLHQLEAIVQLCTGRQLF